MPNHSRYISSVYVTFCGSWKQRLLKHKCLKKKIFREGTFLIGGGGGGPGLRRGGSLLNFFQIVDGQTSFIRDWGRVTAFLARKKLLHVT